jgi:hypothetical protein
MPISAQTRMLITVVSMTANDSARKLLHAHVIVAPVIGVEDDSAANGLCQFEAHLRVAHEVAVLLAIVRN